MEVLKSFFRKNNKSQDFFFILMWDRLELETTTFWRIWLEGTPIVESKNIAIFVIDNVSVDHILLPNREEERQQVFGILIIFSQIRDFHEKR